jgi:hypothetical protein
VWGILLLIVVVVVALLVYGNWREQAREAADQARQQRETDYANKEIGIKKTVKKAASEAKKGNMAAAFKLLDAAGAKWGELADLANGSEDFTKANSALRQKKVLVDAVKSLEGERAEAAKYAYQAAELKKKADALAAKRDTLNKRVRDQIMARTRPRIRRSPRSPGRRARCRWTSLRARRREVSEGSPRTDGPMSA